MEKRNACSEPMCSDEIEDPPRNRKRAEPPTSPGRPKQLSVISTTPSPWALLHAVVQGQSIPFDPVQANNLQRALRGRKRPGRRLSHSERITKSRVRFGQYVMNQRLRLMGRHDCAWRDSDETDLIIHRAAQNSRFPPSESMNFGKSSFALASQ
jgi:hypothetical protein